METVSISALNTGAPPLLPLFSPCPLSLRPVLELQIAHQNPLLGSLLFSIYLYRFTM